MPSFICELPVRFGDVDSATMMYYPKFYHYFHSAFEELFPTRMGKIYADVLYKDGVGFPAAHQECDFRNPVRYGETLHIAISCQKVGTKSVSLRYAMADKATGEVRAECLMTLVCIDFKTGKSQEIPKVYRAMFEGLKP
ncbi:MAG: acyl-CoA thioesterase [Planctomycetota bacterium]